MRGQTRKDAEGVEGEKWSRARSSRSRMVGKVDRIPYPVEDPGSWAPQASAREPSFLSFNKNSRLRKKRKNGAKLDFAETRVSPSLFSQRKQAVWSGLGAGTCKSGMPIKWQFLQYPYRWVVARRSSIPLRLRRPSEPVTRFPAPQHYVLPRPMRSPRGEVFLQVEPRGGNS